jgi:hypothetical protein
VKLLNHRWIIANYSNGELWGEVLLKYFINEDQTVSFEVMNSYLYSKELTDHSCLPSTLCVPLRCHLKNCPPEFPLKGAEVIQNNLPMRI